MAVVAGVALGLALRWLFGWLRRRALETPWGGDSCSWARARPVRAAADARRALGRGRRAAAATAWHSLSYGVLTATLILVATLIVARLVAEGIRATMIRRTGGGQPPPSSSTSPVSRAAARRAATCSATSGVDRGDAHRARRRRPGGRARPAGQPGQPLRRRAHPRLEEGPGRRLHPPRDRRGGADRRHQLAEPTVQQVQNNQAIIPNAKLAQSIIINYFRPQPEMSVLVPVGVSYSSDLDHVERVTREVSAEVMREVEGGVATTSRSSASPGSGLGHRHQRRRADEGVHAAVRDRVQSSSAGCTRATGARASRSRSPSVPWSSRPTGGSGLSPARFRTGSPSKAPGRSAGQGAAERRPPPRASGRWGPVPSGPSDGRPTRCPGTEGQEPPRRRPPGDEQQVGEGDLEPERHVFTDRFGGARP